MSFVTDMFGGGDAPTVDPFKASDIYSTTGSITGGPGGSITSTLSPELQKFYDMYLNAAKGAAPSAEQLGFANQVGAYGQGLFGQAANLDTGAMTNQYYNQVLQGLDPQRQQENVSLANTLFSQGRAGAATGYAGGGYINPEQFALLKAREQANAGIYLTAEDRARQIQQEQLKGGLGYIGLGNELKTAGYALPTSLFGTGVQLGQINNPLIAPSLTGGQYVTGVNTQNAAYQAQQNASDQGFWGGLISAGVSAINPFAGASKGLSSLFSSMPTTGGGGAYTKSIFTP